MTKYHYLDSPDETSPAAQTGGELALRVADAEDLSALLPCIQELAGQPYSKSAERLSRKIRERLQGYMTELSLPQGFPMTATEMEPWHRLETAWKGLAQAQAAWLIVAGDGVETCLAIEGLYCLRQILLLRGMSHCPVPEGLWLDVHWIYTATLESGSAFRRVRRAFLRHRSRTTIEWEYIHTLWLGLSDPFSMTAQELLALDSLLEKWVPMMKLYADGQTGWTIHEKSDSPAQWGTKKDCLRLDFSQFFAFLESQQDLASRFGRFEWAERPDDTVPGELLEHWKSLWEHHAGEGSGGVEGQQIEVEIGLSRVFGRLQGEQPSGAVISVADNQWWRLEEGGRVRVGDLVGLFGVNDESFERLAVVARLSQECGEDVRVRLQLEELKGWVFPVGVQPLYPGDRPLAYQRGLLLQQQDQSILMVAWQRLDEGTVVRLLSGEKVFPVRLSRRHNIARDLLAFACESVAREFQK